MIERSHPTPLIGPGSLSDQDPRPPYHLPAQINGHQKYKNTENFNDQAQGTFFYCLYLGALLRNWSKENTVYACFKNDSIQDKIFLHFVVYMFESSKICMKFIIFEIRNLRGLRISHRNVVFIKIAQKE